MNRRGFLGSLAALVIAPFVPPPTPITFKGIPLISDAIGRPMFSTATYTFWRNRGAGLDLTPMTRDAFDQAMRDVYNDCR